MNYLFLAFILLDQMMSSEEQKQTGVAELTNSQKMALEQWIDAHFVEKKSDKSLYLAFNSNNGKTLQLSDGSVYEVAPQDRLKTALWITPFPIRVEASGDPNYPIKLVNENTGENVKAKQVQ
jgi:hypothetical protein